MYAKLSKVVCVFRNSYFDYSQVAVVPPILLCVVRGGPRVAGLVTEVKDWRRLFVLHCGRGAGIMMCALAVAVATLPCFCHEDYGCVCGCNERNSGDLLSSREDV